MDPNKKYARSAIWDLDDKKENNYSGMNNDSIIYQLPSGTSKCNYFAICQLRSFVKSVDLSGNKAVHTKKYEHLQGDWSRSAGCGTTKGRLNSFRELPIEFAKDAFGIKTSDRPADRTSSVRRAQRELVNQRNERWTGRSIHNGCAKTPLSRHQWRNEWEYCLFPGSP
jgi:hypothetical protein